MAQRAELETVMPAVMAKFGGHSYTIAEGNHARVGLVDDISEPYAVKTFKSLHPYKAGQRLTEEWEILFRLSNPDAQPPLRVPVPQDYEASPPYTVFSRVPGTSYDYPQIAALTSQQRRNAGKRLGHLIAWSGTILPLRVFNQEVRQHRWQSLKWSYDLFFYRQVAAFEHPAYPHVTRTARSAWAAYLRHYPRGADREGDRLNHNALVPENLLWEGGELTGAIDWGDAQQGDVNQELRGASQMGPDILDAAIEELAAQGIEADKDHVIFWDTIRTLGILCFNIRKNNASHPNFKMAARNIQLLQPEEDWSELQSGRSIKN